MTWINQGELHRRYYAEMNGFLTGSVAEYTNGLEFSNSSGTAGMINGTDRLVALVGGLYLIEYAIAWQLNTTGSRSALVFRWRGGTPTQIAGVPAPLNSADVTTATLVLTAVLMTGDLISFGSYQNSGESLSISGGRCALARLAP